MILGHLLTPGLQKSSARTTNSLRISFICSIDRTHLTILSSAFGRIIDHFFVILQTGHSEEEYPVSGQRDDIQPHHSTARAFINSFTQEQCQSVRLFVAFLSEVLKWKADVSHGSQRGIILKHLSTFWGSSSNVS